MPSDSDTRFYPKLLVAVFRHFQKIFSKNGWRIDEVRIKRAQNTKKSDRSSLAVEEGLTCPSSLLS